MCKCQRCKISGQRTLNSMDCFLALPTFRDVPKLWKMNKPVIHHSLNKVRWSHSHSDNRQAIRVYPIATHGSAAASPRLRGHQGGCPSSYNNGIAQLACSRFWPIKLLRLAADPGSPLNDLDTIIHKFLMLSDNKSDSI